MTAAEQIAEAGKRYLYFKNWRTKEVADNPIDVTNRSDREIEKIKAGMAINIGGDWYIGDTLYDREDVA
ncbi:hypothetical protein HOU02_gp275 [Caulobacter phage CcrBL9]|uniref:Uncharacterized protein n=2 Tax=Bertelyvirus TaxID=2733152 RepID=A0A385EEB3_9CAUD|nr:hypothetical protein HOU02_gp275 [Caulobacter phage CcrBL9]YP_009810630.1 hypothetical protein HOU03_gp268 [Caulobacter phage CcrSC]AXQ69450.1 hypothetical protein CcrBL9_gp426 [Caulobacter phage CcrBL9]AXQ70000.1 hypothetical protein CcrSC_gp418 [Caulobacter phage CcrSC]